MSNVIPSRRAGKGSRHGGLDMERFREQTAK
jgi:hypothetical protein